MAGTVEIGQFDDAPETASRGDFRGEYPLIDTSSYDSDELLLPEDSDYEDPSDGEYDTNRVEDEDWEIAERGTHRFIESFFT
jgi:RIO kinase 1